MKTYGIRELKAILRAQRKIAEMIAENDVPRGREYGPEYGVEAFTNVIINAIEEMDVERVDIAKLDSGTPTELPRIIVSIDGGCVMKVDSPILAILEVRDYDIDTVDEAELTVDDDGDHYHRSSMEIGPDIERERMGWIG